MNSLELLMNYWVNAESVYSNIELPRELKEFEDAMTSFNKSICIRMIEDFCENPELLAKVGRRMFIVALSLRSYADDCEIVGKIKLAYDKKNNKIIAPKVRVEGILYGKYENSMLTFK